MSDKTDDNTPIPTDEQSIYESAGLKNFQQLNREYTGPDGYARSVKDARVLFADLGKSDLDNIVKRANIGGLYRIARSLTQQGETEKLRQDFGRDRSKLATYEKLWRALPYCLQQIRDEIETAMWNGTDIPTYTNEAIITRGEDARKAAGVGAKKAKFAQNAPVYMIDPMDRTVAAAALPSGFPGSAKSHPRWEQEMTITKGEDVQMWREIGGNATGYYTVTLPGRRREGARVFMETSRVLFAKCPSRKYLNHCKAFAA